MESTRYSYTDYVNHMIRFWMTTPDHLDEFCRAKADIINWRTVRQVMHSQPDHIRDFIIDVYKRKDMPYRDAVKYCCLCRGWTEGDGWKVIINVCREIARARGLI